MNFLKRSSQEIKLFFKKKIFIKRNKAFKKKLLQNELLKKKFSRNKVC